MKNIRVFFLSENVQFLEVKFSIYLNRRVFVICKNCKTLIFPIIILYLCVPLFFTIYYGVIKGTHYIDLLT